jgi:regulator of protease activity HflC (stomatin/prohibitin superfamily)
MLLVMVGAVGLAVIVLAMNTFFTVPQRKTVIVQRYGTFEREIGPGIHVKVPFIDRVIGTHED